MPSPTISVVIPSYNTRDLTLRCLESVVAIDTSSTEVIVVDDGSDDGTAAAVAGRFPQVNVVELKKNLGFTVAANRGLDGARGELLLLLNSDTEIDPSTVPRLLDAFDRQPRLGIGGAELRFPDGSPQWGAGRRPTPWWLFAQASGVATLVGRLPGYRRLRPPGRSADQAVDWVSGAAMAVRRATWLEVGPFDERYRFYCQDLDLCLTAGGAGWRVEVVGGFRVLHHHGATIGASAGSAAPYHPELMWTDLVRCTAKHDGRGAGRRASAALRTGARLRIAARRVVSTLVPARRRSSWRRDTDAYAVGLTALRKLGD